MLLVKVVFRSLPLSNAAACHRVIIFAQRHLFGQDHYAFFFFSRGGQRRMRAAIWVIFSNRFQHPFIAEKPRIHARNQRDLQQSWRGLSWTKKGILNSIIFINLSMAGIGKYSPSIPLIILTLLICSQRKGIRACMLDICIDC